MDKKKRVRTPKNLRRLSLSVEQISDMEILQSAEDVRVILNLKFTTVEDAKEMWETLDRKIKEHDGTNIIAISVMGPLK